MNKTILTCIGGQVALLWLSTANASVTAPTSNVLIKEQPHPVYHAIKGKTLSAAMAQISKRSGIQFKIAADVQSDKINKKLAADNWNEAISQLLSGYNFSSVSNNGKISSIYISGRNGSGQNKDSSDNNDVQTAAFTSQNKILPARYQGYKSGSVTAVSLPMTKIGGVELGEKVVLDLPIGQYTVNHDDFVDDGNGASTWMGYLEDEGKAYRVYLSQGEAGIMGQVTTPDGNYSIETEAGKTYWIDLTQAGFNLGGFNDDQIMADSDHSDDSEQTELVTAAAQVSSDSSDSSDSEKKPTRKATTALPTVDVMVLYTKTGQTAAYAKQRIKYLVNIANRAYKDSFIKMQLRLVHTRATSYIEKSNNNDALTDLAGNKGVLANTATLRNQYGADVVLLFRPYYASTSNGCGVAYVGFSNGSAANPATGFGVISDGKSKDAPVSHYCGIETFAHEVGHTLGNVHDREFSGFQGRFPYSYAWGVPNKFGTIMSYHGPALMYFATPKLARQCKGQPCGYAAGAANSSDQSATINSTAATVANYRPKKITIPVIQ